jgi:hypothetical protein
VSSFWLLLPGEGEGVGEDKGMGVGVSKGVGDDVNAGKVEGGAEDVMDGEGSEEEKGV